MSKMWLGAAVTQWGLLISAMTRKSLMVSYIPLLSTSLSSPLKIMQAWHVNCLVCLPKFQMFQRKCGHSGCLTFLGKVRANVGYKYPGITAGPLPLPKIPSVQPVVLNLHRFSFPSSPIQARRLGYMKVWEGVIGSYM
jgi:hypothetical protein